MSSNRLWTIGLQLRARSRPANAGFVLRSIGYFGTPLPVSVHDPERGVIPSTEGRCRAGQATMSPDGPNAGRAASSAPTRSALATRCCHSWPTPKAGALSADGTLSAVQVEALMRKRQPAYVDQRPGCVTMTPNVVPAANSGVTFEM